MTSESPVLIGKSQSDSELVAEITPAMAKHLRDSGSLQAMVFWFLIGFAAFSVKGHVDVGQSYLWDIAVIVWCFVGIPLSQWVGARRAIETEVQYRRAYGKWRWDH